MSDDKKDNTKPDNTESNSAKPDSNESNSAKPGKAKADNPGLDNPDTDNNETRPGSADPKSSSHQHENDEEAYENNDDELMKSPDDTAKAHAEHEAEAEQVDTENIEVEENTPEDENTQEKNRMEVGKDEHDPTQDSVQPEDEELSTAADEDLFGIVAEFTEVEEIREAARKTRDAGYTSIEAYTPFPIEELPDDLGHAPTRLGWVVLLMGITGGLVGFFTQLYSAAEFYPLNIGGKPLNSWPNFIVITFECTVLFSAFTAGLFMLGRNGLPRPYHPIFNTPNFENATRDRFFLCIEADDPKFELEGVKGFLNDLKPQRVSEVEY